MKTTDFFQKYPELAYILIQIKNHLDHNYDYPLVIAGDTGTGKSMLALHIIELWNKIILGREFTEEDIKHISSDKKVWVNNFKAFSKKGENGSYEINVFDEGANGLNSKESITRFSRDIEKLYQVFRKLKFFSIIIIPTFFRLNKYFREDRVRGLIWVDKRGHFKFYTKDKIKWLNGLNQSRTIKNMYVTSPFFQGLFPDYEGVLKEPYIKQSEVEAYDILDEVIASSNEEDNDVKIWNKEEFIADVHLFIKDGNSQRKTASMLTDKYGKYISQKRVNMIINK